MTATKIIGSVVLIAAIAAAIGIFVPAEYFLSRNPREIDYYGDATQLKLRRYEVTGLPYEMRSWLEGPHDGAFGQQIAYVFLRWGLKNPEEFVFIIEGTDRTKSQHIAEWLGGMTEDAMIEAEFLEAFARFDSPVVSQMKSNVMKRRR